MDWNFEVPKLVTEGQYVPPPVIRPVLPDLEPWRPHTPPVEEDAMDWTPSQNFEKPKLIRYKDPSPFYGRLPGVQSEVKEAIGLPIGHSMREETAYERAVEVGDGRAKVLSEEY